VRSPKREAYAVSSRSVGRPKDVDSADTRQRLLDAARRSFARYGYSATTNKRVAADAGITSAAIYHYFGSQADLFAAVYDEVQTTVFSSFEKAIAEAHEFVERFNSVLDTAVALNREDSSLAGFLMSAATDIVRHPELRDSTESSRNKMSAFMHRLVSEGIDSGEVRDSANSQALEDLLSSMLNGLAGFSNMTGDPGRHAAAVELLKRSTRALAHPNR
jgi:AcrR family transcriptional regulator